MIQTTITSLPSVEAANLEQFWDVIRRLDPELYLIKLTIKETNLNPLIVPKIVRSISNLAMGTKFGKVTIHMSNGVITQIQGEESDKVDLNATIEEN